MNIVIVSAVFPPEPVVTAQTSFQIADELFHHGHQVTVLSPFPNRPDGRLFKGYRRSLYRRENMGFSVIRCFSFLSRKSTMSSRLLENIGFAITCSGRLLMLPRPDVLYMNTWGIVCSGMVSAVAWLRGIPVAVSIQDIYPESLSQQKRISPHSFLFRVLRAIDRSIAHSAKALIVISDQFRETYQLDRGVPAERIYVLQNWGETSAVNVDARAAYGLRQKYGILDQTTLAVYAGNIGAAAGVETAIKAFEYLWNEENICMLIAGVGSSLRACQQLVEEKKLQDRIFFHTPWPKKDTGIVLGAADVLLLPTLGEQSLVSIPSKLISYMLSGRPVLAMVLGNSETARLITKAKAGWVIPPDDPAGTAAALKIIAASAAEDLRAAGAHGLDYALSNLTREANLPRMIQLLLETAEPCPFDRFSNSSDLRPKIVNKRPGCAGKRLFDLTVAIVALIVSAPLFGLVAVAIKVTSSGPVLFRQERIGWQGRMFHIIKFRSMVHNAPDIRNSDDSAYSSDTDLRVTPLGRFLRRTSLDEMPQLWNVVRGEMSLIGPRPELAEGIRSYRPADFRRLHVRPGMTGWAVVHGRNDVPISMRRDLDTWYADHAGFLLDLKIICKTIATVVASKGINRTGGQPIPDASSGRGAEAQRCSREN